METDRLVRKAGKTFTTWRPWLSIKPSANLAGLLALPCRIAEFSCVPPHNEEEKTVDPDELSTTNTKLLNNYFWQMVIYIYMCVWVCATFFFLTFGIDGNYRQDSTYVNDTCGQIERNRENSSEITTQRSCRHWNPLSADKFSTRSSLLSCEANSELISPTCLRLTGVHRENQDKFKISAFLSLASMYPASF